MLFDVFFLYLHSLTLNFTDMKIRLIAVLALMIGLTACHKKDVTKEVTNVLKSDAVIFTEKHWTPLHNGQSIRMNIEANTRELGILREDSTMVDTSWFAKIFIDSSLIAHTEELPWEGVYLVDLEPGNHEMFVTGRINLKEFSLHGISLYVTE